MRTDSIEHASNQKENVVSLLGIISGAIHISSTSASLVQSTKHHTEAFRTNRHVLGNIDNEIIFTGLL